MTSQNNFSLGQFDPALVQVQAGSNPGDPQTQIDNLRGSFDDQIRNHFHDGNGGQRIRLNNDIDGLFETVSTAPASTTVPRTIFDQIKIYSSGGVFKLYVYDSVGQAWHFTTLT